MIDIPKLLKNVYRCENGWTARCPVHDDKQNSLSIKRTEDRWLIKCFAGCTIEQIVAALGIETRDLFTGEGGGGESPWVHSATAQPLTLLAYANAKRLPVDFLKSLGLSEMTYQGATAVRIPYLSLEGEQVATRFRLSLEGPDRFRWKKGDKPCLYGLSRLAEARVEGYVVLVEGESDVQTLCFHGIPAIGLPGAANWKEVRDVQHLEGFDAVYVVIEGDRGGEAVKGWLRKSAIRDRARLVTLGEYKDPSGLHFDDPERFLERWAKVIAEAVSYQEIERKETSAERTVTWLQCEALAREGNILESLAADLTASGVVGEARAVKLLYLALTSRFLERPVSVVVKGPSSAGKSHLVKGVVAFFPEEAYYDLTGLSEMALVYDTEPLKHRFLVIYEADGMAKTDYGEYLIRSLLSEHRLRYKTVVKSTEGLEARMIEREGPTGLMLTTTALKLHPENETRIFSITITDSPEQTRAVFRVLAADSLGEVNLTRWHALQTWLAHADHKVEIPYAKDLVELIPPQAVRLRRDVGATLSLIKAHAILHQANRERSRTGAIIATLEDYAACRDLVLDVIAEGIGLSVPKAVRETVDAVKHLIDEGAAEVMSRELCSRLGLDKSSVSRRVRDALDRGFLKNREERKNRPHRLVLGDPLPDDLEILPSVERLRSCAVSRGDTPPAPPDQDADHDAELEERRAIMEIDGEAGS